MVVVFQATERSPVVRAVARVEGEKVTPLVLGFKGGVYDGTNGALLASDTDLVSFAASLGSRPEEAKPKDVRRLRQAIDLGLLNRLLGPKTPPKPPPVLTEQEQARLAVELKFKQFVEQFKHMSVPDRDPRVPQAAKDLWHKQRGFLFVIEVPDRKKHMGAAIAHTSGVFFPATPRHEEGMGAAARNTWVARTLADGYASFK